MFHNNALGRYEEMKTEAIGAIQCYTNMNRIGCKKKKKNRKVLNKSTEQYNSIKPIRNNVHMCVLHNNIIIRWTKYAYVNWRFLLASVTTIR